MALTGLHLALAASTYTRVIIESPCAGANGEQVQRNEDYLHEALLDSIKRGEAPIASHGLLAFSGVLDDANPEERRSGMAAGFAWYASAERIVVYADLGISPGMEQGIELARHLGKPVDMRHIRPGPVAD